MIALTRVTVLGLLMSAAVCSVGGASESPGTPPPQAWLGACYCRAAGTLHCAANLTERECQRRCDDALSDDWFWKERLPCWNWGYGG